MPVRPHVALIISALTLGACGTETPTSPVVAASPNVTAVKTIGVSPTSLHFFWYALRSTPVPNQVLKISNLGSGTLTWTATSSTWLKLSPASGTAPTSVTVKFYAPGTHVGLYGYRPPSLSGYIKVSATGATNTPLTVPVGLIISYH